MKDSKNVHHKPKGSTAAGDDGAGALEVAVLLCLAALLSIGSAAYLGGEVDQVFASAKFSEGSVEAVSSAETLNGTVTAYPATSGGGGGSAQTYTSGGTFGVNRQPQ